MENDELKNIWSAFSKNLDSVEKANKQVLKQMISRKSEIKLTFMKIQSILGILIIPLIFVFIIIPLIINNDKTLYLLIGSMLLLILFVYGFVQALNYYKLLNMVKPAFEPVIKTQGRILTLRKFMVKLQKSRNLFFPIEAGAFILIFWDKINYELPIKIVLLFGIFIGVYFWGKVKYRLYFQDRIDSIDLEMKELEEYQ